jgi:ATP/maltotriose-dependent transcriptional regulator MalT
MRWIDALPAHALDAQPELHLAYALALLTLGRYEAVETRLQSVENRQASQPPEQQAELRGRVAAVRTCLAGLAGDLQHATRQYTLTTELLTDPQSVWRAYATGYVGTAHLAYGNLPGAEAAFREAVRLNGAAGNGYEVLIARWRLARIAALQGELRQAETGLRQVQQQAEAPGSATCPSSPTLPSTWAISSGSGTIWKPPSSTWPRACGGWPKPAVPPSGSRATWRWHVCIARDRSRPAPTQLWTRPKH